MARPDAPEVADAPPGGILDIVIPVTVMVLAGLTLLFTGYNDLVAGETIIRERGKKDVVAHAVGPLASTFNVHVWGSLALGAVLLVGGIGLLLYLRFGSPAGRARLLAFGQRRSRLGIGARKPPWAAQLAAVLVVALLVWVLAGRD
jgi:hypothetical protein